MANIGVRALSVVAFAVAMIGLPVHSPTYAAACFTPYDNTTYSDYNIGQRAGFADSNIIYNRWNADTSAGKSPDVVQFKDEVRARNVNPGPVVLDFEDIFLEGTETVVRQRLAIWHNLLTWTRQVLTEQGSTQKIGIFAFTEHVDDQYLSLAKELNGKIDAFFPEMYRYPDVDQAEWNYELNVRATEARLIDSTKPVYPYIWPQYPKYDGTTPPGQEPGVFYEGTTWRQQLNALKAHPYINGFVVWNSGSWNTVGNHTSWADETIDFVASLPTC